MAEGKKEAKGFKKFISGIGRLFRDLKSEFTKIVWPSKKQVINNTLIVIAAILVIGAFIWGLDAILSLIVSALAKL